MKYIKALLICCLIALRTVCIVQSEPLPPSAGYTATKPEANTRQNEEKTQPDNQSPKNNSAIVEISEAPAIQIEPTKKTEERNEYFSAEWWVVYFTGMLAAITAALAIYTAKLYRATVKLGEDAKLTSERQSKEMQISLAISEKAAIAAEQANQLSTTSYIAANRPWLQIRYEIGGPLSYNANGLHVAIRLHIKNIGHAPAFHAFPNVKLVAPALGVDPPCDVTKMFMEFISSHRINDSTLGFTIFPGDTVIQDIGVGIGTDELKRITQASDFLWLRVLGSVTYCFVFAGSEAHQTGFLFKIERSNMPREVSTAKKRNPSGIFVDEGDVPATELCFVDSLIDSSYAD